MPEEGGDKTHEPTPRRREQAREEGNVAKSQDLASALILLAAVVLLMTQGKAICTELYAFTEKNLSGETFLYVADQNDLVSYFIAVILRFTWLLSLFFLLLVAAAILVNLAQVGFLWLPNKLAFKPSHLDPIKGFGRIFSMQSVVRLVMGIVKITICAMVAFFAVIKDIDQILGLIELSDGQISMFLFQTILWVALKMAVALVILAILDYLYQKWKYERDLRMTTQEIREEMKNTLGNPEILQRRRQLQREMAQQRMGQSVPQADVVVTNPTELAVALRWDETMIAPIVLAKGAGLLAQKIRRIALEHGITIYEHKPLAQALYKNVEINQTIPSEYWSAVAEILGFVYRQKGRNVPPKSAA
ncbi:MAG: flagellar biosynthesis protein FlhB [Planctomycetaceae bacterium]|nr:flagellar biosynthesis protein FlhB [Planctomycetaceae bacterium]